jgi:hypothetical protein
MNVNREIILEALKVGAERQHERTADHWGEAACTEQTPCVFCQAIVAMKWELDKREIATILAALRLWQETVNKHEEEPWKIATDDGQLEPLSDDEIDDLCEKLNGFNWERS